MSGAAVTTAAAVRGPATAREVTLLDLLDRLLEGGVVLQGEITLAAADIDLVDVSLRLVAGSVGTLGRDMQGPVRRNAGRA